MADVPWVIREALAGDGEFLADMLVAMANCEVTDASVPQSETMVKDLTTGG